MAPWIYEIEGCVTIAQHLYCFGAKYVSTLGKQLKLRGRSWTWQSDRCGFKSCLFHSLPGWLWAWLFTSRTPFLQNGTINAYLTMMWKLRATGHMQKMCASTSEAFQECYPMCTKESWTRDPPQASRPINQHLLTCAHGLTKSSGLGFPLQINETWSRSTWFTYFCTNRNLLGLR